MRRPAPLLAASALLAAAALLASCGPDTAGAEGNNTTPQRGGDIKVGLEHEPRTLDPLYADQASELEVLRQIFEPLVDVDSSSHLVPRLAVSWAFTDATTLVLRLRRGVSFQNGEPFTAAAVRFSIEREIDAGPSPRSSDVADIASVSAPSTYLAELHLKRPEPAILYALAGPAGMMVSPVAAAAQGARAEFGRNPVVAGTGPFEFQFWRRGYHIILERYGRYWGPQPLVNELDFTQTDLSPGLDRLETSDLDVLQGLARGDVARAGGDPDLQLSWRPGFTYEGLALSEAPGSPFASLAARQAVAGAVDRAAVVSKVLHGIDRPATGPLPPGSWAYDPALKAPVAAAAPRPFTFTLKVDTEPQAMDEALLLRSQLRKAGITMLVQPEDPDTLRNELEAHQFEAALVQQGGGPDPGSSLAADFHTGGPDNFGQFSDPRVDGDLDAARAVSDRAARTALYQDAQRRLLADAAFVFISYPPVFDLHGRWVHGLTLRPDGTLDLSRAWIG